MSFDAEVIVAGAGPAGAVAARTLAKAGVQTLLVERAAFPRNKPCGGGISVRALRRFPWLTEALGAIDVHHIGTLHLEGPGGATLDVTSPDPSVLLVRRVEFDYALVRAAEVSGARLVERFEITQAEATDDHVELKARDGRRLRAPFVVAADGVHSVIGKRLGVNPRWPAGSLAIDMMEETPLETLRAERPDVLWVAYAYNGLDGYAYVFPKVRHVNVGIGCLLAHFKGEVPERPYELQRQFVHSLVGAGVLHGESDRRHFTPFLIPVGGPLRRAHAGRVLFAGDAGGFVNAITAEGIYYAMVAGELAGQALARARGGGVRSVGRAYDRAWRSEIGVELSDAVRVQRFLFHSHPRVAGAIRAAASRRWLVDLILKYVRGDMGYHALRRRLLLRFPLAIWQMATLPSTVRS